MAQDLVGCKQSKLVIFSLSLNIPLKAVHDAVPIRATNIYYPRVTLINNASASTLIEARIKHDREPLIDKKTNTLAKNASPSPIMTPFSLIYQ